MSSQYAANQTASPQQQPPQQLLKNANANINNNANAANLMNNGGMINNKQQGATLGAQSAAVNLAKQSLQSNTNQPGRNSSLPNNSPIVKTQQTNAGAPVSPHQRPNAGQSASNANFNNKSAFLFSKICLDFKYSLFASYSFYCLIFRKKNST